MINIDELIKNSQKLTLLYVEDNQDSREITSMIFEDFFYKIIVAVDGEDAYKKYLQNNIDLIITDVNMPKMNGLELCKKIRETDNEISLVVLSARSEDICLTESLKYGVSDYLFKPLNIDKLSSIIFKVTQKNK